MTPAELEAALRGPPWGFLENGRFIPVPKQPLILADLRAPCTITLPDGRRRDIVIEPKQKELI